MLLSFKIVLPEGNEVSYFTTKEIAAIALCATLWGVLNTLFAPIFFRMFGLPFLCDLIGFSVLILATWWIRKLGSITLIGLIATVINFGLGGGFQFIGFTVASIFFDFATGLIGYNTCFKKPNTETLSGSLKKLPKVYLKQVNGTKIEALWNELVIAHPVFNVTLIGVVRSYLNRGSASFTS